MVGLDASNGVSGVTNVASLQNINDVQQGNLKGHKFSISKDSVVNSFDISSSINFPNKTLAQRQVAVAHL